MKGRWLSSAVILTGLLWLYAGAAVAAEQKDGTSGAPPTFSYARVVDKAKSLAAESYEPRDKIPEFLQKLNYKTLNQIEFRPQKALWSGDKIPFEVRFHHPGSFYVYPVTIRIVTDDGVKPLPFSTDYFNYPSKKMRQRIPKDLGFAGLKIMHQLNSAAYLDEIVSFLGASYFRAVPEGAHFGLSARGLAINTATNGGEEFPAFTDFWLVKPDPGDKEFTLYALLDSPSVTGAYKFVINPGGTTEIDVTATLFTRTAIKKIGIAPLTSMFMWGENSLHRLAKSRPEAHDSDGLLIHNGNGEWLWRPLKNPQKLTINQFVSEHILGFGLLQRDRNFSHYQHLTHEYEHRPSVWVVPEGNWGPGAVELVQLPSDSEVNDNIVAYWIPDNPVKADEKLRFDYTLKWLMQEPTRHDRGITHATRIGYAEVKPGQQRKWLRIAVEFTGGALPHLTQSGSVLARVTTPREVKLKNVKTMRNPHTDGWRLSFLVPTGSLNEPLELRAYLATPEGQALTETWTYTLAQ